MPTPLRLLLPLALAACAACAERGKPQVYDVAPGAVPVEVATFLDVRMGVGVAAPTVGWFQRQVSLELARRGFDPRPLPLDQKPSGQGYALDGRLYALPSLFEGGTDIGEVSFRARLTRDGRTVLEKNYQTRVWFGWHAMGEMATAESSTREALAQALTDLGADLQGAVPAAAAAARGKRR